MNRVDILNMLKNYKYIELDIYDKYSYRDCIYRIKNLKQILECFFSKKLKNKLEIDYNAKLRLVSNKDDLPEELKHRENYILYGLDIDVFGIEVDSRLLDKLNISISEYIPNNVDWDEDSQSYVYIDDLPFVPYDKLLDLLDKIIERMNYNISDIKDERAYKLYDYICKSNKKIVDFVSLINYFNKLISFLNNQLFDLKIGFNYLFSSIKDKFKK